MKRWLLPLAITAAAMSTAACGSSTSDSASSPGPTSTDDANELQQKKLMIRVPLVADSKQHELLSSHNAQLKAAGLSAFPDFVEIEGSKSGFATKASHKKWDDAVALHAQAQEKIPSFNVEMVSFGEPLSYSTGDKSMSMCYVGNPKLVVNLIGSLTDSVFSDQLGIHGWRWKQTKRLDENLTPEDEKTFPKIWHEWRGDGDAILMLTHTSDGGEEMDVNIIPKCR